MKKVNEEISRDWVKARCAKCDHVDLFYVEIVQRVHISGKKVGASKCRFGANRCPKCGKKALDVINMRSAPCGKQLTLGE